MKHEIFVPGSLCLFGEHSDWAGKYRTINADIVPGAAIVTGIEQGIYATVEKNTTFKMSSEAPEIFEYWKDFECRMDFQELKEIARSGSFFCYCAGVASYMLEWYKVGGIHIHLTKMDMPMKSGLSSSAAICVLVCRAFNELYHLNLNTKGEMNIAYWGELRTSSRCGRLDQACAFGVRPVKMTFDAEDIDVETINLKKTLYWVFANLNASKDTIRILSDLHKAYPFAQTEQDRSVQNALGEINQNIVNRAIEYMRDGKVEELGNLMNESQTIFDMMVAPSSPSQLNSPLLHKTLSDPNILLLVYGGKGVGSQGDGSIQFLARDSDSQQRVVDYLNSLGMPAYSLSIKPNHSIRKAIIPVAGFGTRLYPMTRFLKKDFFPIVDNDGLVKPVILVLIEECLAAGIEEICLVLGSEEDREDYRKFFETKLTEEHLQKLPAEKRRYEDYILEIGKKLHFVYQIEKKGFGDAVYRCVDFASKEPVLLLLGDTIYKSNTNKNCALQLIEAFEEHNKPMISIHEIPLKKVSHYGIISGLWTDSTQKVLNMSCIYEKPTVEYAEKYLGVGSPDEPNKYFSVFGQYILTYEVFEQLKENIENGIVSERGEIELTTALEQIREKTGMIGIQLDGEMFDTGVPTELKSTVSNF